MTLTEALKECETGKPVRHPGMGKGWTMVWISGAPYYLNPITKSNYSAAPFWPSDQSRADWRVVD